MTWRMETWPTKLCTKSKTYQVEADLLEITEKYLHVSIAVDDGSLPESIRPASQSFLCGKKP